MPNHVETTIKIIGTESEIKAVRDFMKGEKDEDGHSNPFDFNRLIPMPPSLRITSGSSTSNGIALAKALDSEDFSGIDEILSRAWCAEKGIETREQMIENLKNDGYTSLEEGRMAIENEEKYGHQDWYSWSVDVWGTKWNSYSHFLMEEGDDGDWFGFSTAWAHPFQIIEALSNKFSNVQFDIAFADEDTGYNVGRYSILDGEIIDEFFPEGGSAEAYELAFEINGSDYEEYDVFLDYDEEDFVGNEYMEACLNLAIKHRSLDEDIPTWVLHTALENCVEDENFEYAEKLKGFIALAEGKEK
jgi:hypothetical protein